ncbi:MAG TPA: N-acetylmuramoyl-L-alanine amidase, partial [Beijerinckiaceae bacterium]
MASERLTPESRVAAKVFPSPNHGARAGERRPDMLILHYTGMPDEGEALQWLANPLSQVSAHYFVFENGHIVQMVPEIRRAWHAGAGSWAGDTDINSCSIGV